MLKRETKMGSSEKFCLQWNDFEKNISVAFREVREDKDFFDCTLSCGTRHIQAHKLVLAACSTFFRSILRQNPHQHPLLYLKGVEFSDLEYVLDFMYNGEVSVAQVELNSFLAVAEDLQVKGLTQENSSKNCNKKSDDEIAVPKKQNKKPNKIAEIPVAEKGSHAKIYDDDVLEVTPEVKSEPQATFTYSDVSKSSSIVQQGSFHNMGMEIAPVEDFGDAEYQFGSEYEVQQHGYDEMPVDGDSIYQNIDVDVVRTHATRIENAKYSCNLCGSVARDKYNIRLHLEGLHELGSGYQCDKCKKIVKTRKDLSEHYKSRCLHAMFNK